jgi:hypothetical protein
MGDGSGLLCCDDAICKRPHLRRGVCICATQMSISQVKRCGAKSVIQPYHNVSFRIVMKPISILQVAVTNKAADPLWSQSDPKGDVDMLL